MTEKLLTEEIKDIAHRMITASSDHALSRPEFEGYLKAILAKTASAMRAETLRGLLEGLDAEVTKYGTLRYTVTAGATILNRIAEALKGGDNAR